MSIGNQGDNVRITSAPRTRPLIRERLDRKPDYPGMSEAGVPNTATQRGVHKRPVAEAKAPKAEGLFSALDEFAQQFLDGELEPAEFVSKLRGLMRLYDPYAGTELEQEATDEGDEQEADAEGDEQEAADWRLGGRPVVHHPTSHGVTRARPIRESVQPRKRTRAAQTATGLTDGEARALASRLMSGTSDQPI